jgi:hypothetical protein
MNVVVKVFLVIITIFTAILFIIWLSIVLWPKNNLGKEIEEYLPILWPFLGSIWAFLGIVSTIITLRTQSKQSEKGGFYKKFFKSSPSKLFSQEVFLNREQDILNAIKYLESERVINIFGRKGIGKSEVIKIVCDYINQHNTKFLRKKINELSDIKLGLKIALYVDLSDLSNKDEIISQIGQSLLRKEIKTLIGLLNELENSYGSKAILYSIDNVNNLVTQREVARIVNQILLVRKNDRIIIGSIFQMRSIGFSCKYIEIKPLKQNDFSKLSNFEGKEFSKSEIEEIYKRTFGIPIYLQLLYRSKYKGFEIDQTFEIREIVIQVILPQLHENTQKAIIALSFLNLSQTTIDFNLLSKFVNGQFDQIIFEARQFSLIIDSYLGEKRELKVHDIIRDIIVSEFLSSSNLNIEIYEYYKEANDNCRALFHWIITEKKIEDLPFAIDVITKEAEKENSSFFIGLWDLTHRFVRSPTINRSHQLRQTFDNWLAFGYITALCSIGDYPTAENISKDFPLDGTGISSLAKIETDLDFKFHFLLADLDHLINQYAKALVVTEQLLNYCHFEKFNKFKPRVLWMLAHLYGHLGTDLDSAETFYKDCLEVSCQLNQPNFRLRSINGLAAISAVRNHLDWDYEKTLTEAIKEAENIDGANSIVASLYRNLARLRRREKYFINAQKALNESFKVCRDNELRTLYNCHYAQGEIARAEGKYKSAVKAYEIACNFNKVNKDENLRTSSTLCIIMCEILQGEPLYFKSWDNSEEALLECEKIAEELSMTITSFRTKIIRNFFVNSLSKNKLYDNLKLKDQAFILGLKYEYERLNETPSIVMLKEMEIHVH